jgi:mono/diheme cytochrome c family protein
MEQSPQFKEEMDFRDLLRSPRKLFGFSYVYFFKLFLALGVLYVWNLNDMGKNTIIPLVLSDSSAFVQDIPMQSPSVLPPVDVRLVAQPTAQLTMRGRDLFKSNCASCHGDNGLGDGPAGVVLNPRPRNFHQAAGWTNGAKVSEIYKTLQEGIVKNGMASYSYLPPADRFALIHFVRSFHPSAPADAEQDIALLETTYQLSKGSVVPAQIPIKEAMRHIAAEQKPRIDLLAARAAGVRAARTDPGAVLFERFVSNPAKLLAACTARRETIVSAEDFVRIVSTDPPAVGVRPAVVSLDAHDWSVFHQFVLAEVR